MSNNYPEYYKYALWPKLRKWTCPIHWIFGLFLAWFCWECFLGGILLLVIFGVWEFWNDWSENTKTGFLDWHETFAPLIGGLAVQKILFTLGIIGPIKWI